LEPVIGPAKGRTRWTGYGERADARFAENPRFAWILRYDFLRIAVATGAARLR